MYFTVFFFGTSHLLNYIPYQKTKRLFKKKKSNYTKDSKVKEIHSKRFTNSLAHG